MSLQRQKAQSMGSLGNSEIKAKETSSFRKFNAQTVFNTLKRTKKSPKTEQKTLTRDEVRQKASERYCLELVLFSEEYEALILIQDEQERRAKVFEIWKEYFSKKSSNEMNVRPQLSDDFRRSVLMDDFNRSLVLLKEINFEVVNMLAENGILTTVHPH